MQSEFNDIYIYTICCSLCKYHPYLLAIISSYTCKDQFELHLSKVYIVLVMWSTSEYNQGLKYVLIIITAGLAWPGLS